MVNHKLKEDMALFTHSNRYGSTALEKPSESTLTSVYGELR